MKKEVGTEDGWIFVLQTIATVKFVATAATMVTAVRPKVATLNDAMFNKFHYKQKPMTVIITPPLWPPSLANTTQLGFI